MIKILYVTREPFPSFRVDIIDLFGKYLPRLNVYTSILSYRDPKTNLTKTWRGLKHITYRRKRSKLLTPFYGIFEVFFIWRYGRHYDIIQVRDKPFVGLIALFIARYLKKKFVFWESFLFPEGDIQRSFLKSIPYMKRVLLFIRGVFSAIIQYKILMRLAPYIVVQSKAMKEWLTQKWKIPQNKMFTVPMGVDMEEVDEFRQRYSKIQQNPNKIVLCYLGQISETRGIDLLFKVLKRLNKEKKHVHLLLIGDISGSDGKRYLEEISNSPDLRDRFTCTGWLPRDEVMRRLIRCDIGISIMDNSITNYTRSPTKVMEYAAYGIPVIVSRVPDQQYIVEKTKCGIIVQNNEESVYNAIKLLIKNDKLREQLGRNGMSNIGKIRGYKKISYDVMCYYKDILQR